MEPWMRAYLAATAIPDNYEFAKDLCENNQDRTYGFDHSAPDAFGLGGQDGATRRSSVKVVSKAKACACLVC